MEYILVALIALVLVLLVVVVVLLLKPKKGDTLSFEHITLLQSQISDLSQGIDAKISRSSHEMNESLRSGQHSSQALLKDVTDRLLEVQKGLSESTESSKQVLTITETLQNLEKVLKNQKQRGNLGEAGLKLILESILPPEVYETQYYFPNGEAVDAVIKAKDGIICIDSKFSYDNYMRFISEEDEIRKTVLEKEFKNDLKKRIDETAKYIRPIDGTLGFALMYIPAEGMYYDLLIGQSGSKVNAQNLIDYANSKKVIIVSPMTLYAYLHTILHGFNAYKIEKQTVEIQKNVQKLVSHLRKYDEYHTKLGTTLGTVVNHYNSSRKEFVKIDKDVLKISGESAEIVELVLEKPDHED